MTNEIQWEDGATCFFNGEFHDETISSANEEALTYVINLPDFQLNEIRTGDFITASELDTEQKYNDVVEVFGLFGATFSSIAASGYSKFIIHKAESIAICDDGAWHVSSQFTGYKRQLTYNQIMTIGKLKRMSDEKKASSAVSTVNRDIERNLKDGDKYHREIVGLDGTKTTVDVYRVLDAFPTDCSATDHAIKKMLCAGLRGHKDKITDIDNAIESLQAAKKLLIQKSK